ncbi:hypothetical protein MCOR25_002958 [Pyricularia grisea]|nr:hypothetical protein MCOR25_002958 [Pyricularia grisea]
MTTKIVAVAALGLLCHANAVSAQNNSGACSTVLEPANGKPVFGGGWVGQLAANNLNSPRGIILDKNGNLLVVERSRGIRRITWKDDGGVCVNVDKSESLVQMSELNHGIELSEDGKTLYASTADVVYSWNYDAAAGTVSDRKTLVQNMTNSGHTSRTLMLSRKQKGMLLVSRGSAENMDMTTRNVASGISQIRAFDLNNMPNGRPFNHASEGELIGWGLRNSVGIAEHPVTGGIYSVENSADDVERMGRDIHRDNPGEEMNSHGALNDSSLHGRNYGYPDCFALWDTNIPDRGNLNTGSQFALGNIDGVNDEKCAKDYQAPRLTFQAHTAPLDIKFSNDGNEAYVSFHGSWNRDDPVGYRLSRIQFENGEPKERPDSRNSTSDIMSNPNLSACPRGCFRPVGLAVDSKGRIFMSSDSTGEIYVLQQSEKSTGGIGNGSNNAGGSNGSAAPYLSSSSLLGSLLLMLYYCFTGLVR